MKKKLYLFISLISFCFLQINLQSRVCEQKKQKIVLMQLPLYNFLLNVQEFEEHDMQEALNLITNIANRFNKGVLFYSPEIESSFFKICEFLGQYKEIKPRHLRQLRELVEKFDADLKCYIQKREYFLKDSDLNFLSNLRKFSRMLLEKLLDEKFFDFGFCDKFCDFVFQRPWEEVCKYKAVTIPVAVASFNILTYFGIHQLRKYLVKNQTLNSVSNPTLFSLDDLNEKFTVEQFVAYLQQGLDCGYHSLKNTLCMMCGKDTKKMKEMLQDEKLARDFVRECKRVLGRDVNKSDYMLRSDEIQALFNNERIQDFVIHRMGIVNFDNIIVIDDMAQIPRKANEPMTEEQILATVVRGLGVARSIERFREIGAAQGIIWQSGAHWLSARVDRDYGEVLAYVVNSIPSNVTNNSNLNYIIDLYSNRADALEQYFEHFEE